MPNSCISSSDIGNPCQSMSLFGSVFVEGHEAKVVCPIKTSSVLYGEGTREVWSSSERIFGQNSHPTLPWCDGNNMYQWCCIMMLSCNDDFWWCIVFFLHDFCSVFFVLKWFAVVSELPVAYGAKQPTKQNCPGSIAVHPERSYIWHLRFRQSFLWKKLWKIVQKSKKITEIVVKNCSEPRQLHTGVDIRHLARDDWQAPRPYKKGSKVPSIYTTSHLWRKENQIKMLQIWINLYVVYRLYRWNSFKDIRCINDI